MCIYNRVLLNFRKCLMKLLKKLYGSANFTLNCQYLTVFSNAKLSGFWFFNHVFILTFKRQINMPGRYVYNVIACSETLTRFYFII